MTHVYDFHPLTRCWTPNEAPQVVLNSQSCLALWPLQEDDGIADVFITLF